MMVDLRGKKCVVVGGGRIAHDKIAGLITCGARIVVVSPRADRRIQKKARAGELAWKQRRFSASDIEDAFLVIAATNAPGVNEAVFRACRAQGVSCNAVDDPQRCDFFYPAIVRRGPLQIAISTNGLSPALASRLRKELEQQFGPEWGAWVEHLGKRRREILRAKMPAEKRRRMLLKLVSPTAFRTFLRSQERRADRAKRRNRARRG
jgi:precorrin-2 dehydrogenase / sirohydrochlorin ferrochelatase